VNRLLPRGARVYESLRESIRSGRLPPGERLRETDIAERLGVSRTPVREALRRLQSDGLVTFAPWRGMTVAALDLGQLEELYDMREVLESAAARFAATNATDADVAGLRSLLDEQAAAGSDAGALERINRAFHDAIYRAAHNRYLLGALSSLADSLGLLKNTTFSLAGRPESGLVEHRRIVDAIAARDPAVAEDAARRHIARARDLRLHLFQTEQRLAAPDQAEARSLRT